MADNFLLRKYHRHRQLFMATVTQSMKAQRPQASSLHHLQLEPTASEEMKNIVYK